MLASYPMKMGSRVVIMWSGHPLSPPFFLFFRNKYRFFFVQHFVSLSVSITFKSFSTIVDLKVKFRSSVILVRYYFISIHSVLNKLLHSKKYYFRPFRRLFLKSSKALSVSLNKVHSHKYFEGKLGNTKEKQLNLFFYEVLGKTKMTSFERLV